MMAGQRTRLIGTLVGTAALGASLALPVAARTSQVAVPLAAAPALSVTEAAAAPGLAIEAVAAPLPEVAELAATAEAADAAVEAPAVEALPVVHVALAIAAAAPAVRPAAAPAAVAPAPAAQNASSPAQTVTAFYAAISQRQLDAALQHWSPRMRANYPPGVYLYDRFSGTRQMVVRSANVVSMNAATGVAVVAVDLLETSSTPAFNRAWQGTWHLVRTPAGVWQLDAPSFRV